MLIPATAHAGPVSVDVRSADGAPLAGAVVTVDTAAAPASTPRRTYQMEQRGIAFAPHILIVPVGATVSFPNRDTVRHHVYSFSKAKRFDLKLYGREDTRSVVFDKPGVVTLGCNIHDQMSGVVFVTAAPFAATTGDAGRAALGDVPAGPTTIRVWHPSIRAPGNSLAQTVALGAGGLSTTVTIRR